MGIEWKQRMVNNVDSERSPEAGAGEPQSASWLKVVAVAGASALAGGLAAAWFYRKTLAQLRDAEQATPAQESLEPSAWVEEDGDGI